MLTVSGLYIYPIKSLGGIAVKQARLTSRGLAHDRRLMITDMDNRCITQREIPQMALLRTSLSDEGIRVQHKNDPTLNICIPYQPNNNTSAIASIWDDQCMAIIHDEPINNWFSQVLGIDCRLLYMPDNSERPVSKKYALNNEITSFADAYPILIIGQSSLDDLNSRLAEALPMNRFRPNIVFTGGEAFIEDKMERFFINGTPFSCVKPCARCVMTTIDQENPRPAKEPLRTLSAYRRSGNNILFGQNVLYAGDGVVSVGDLITIEKYREPIFNLQEQV